MFIKLRLPFESEGAAQLNRDIFETIYFAALTASKDIAKVEGPYETYAGSPVSKGKTISHSSLNGMKEFCSLICGELLQQTVGIGVH